MVDNITTYTIGPGTLTFGAGPLAVAAQIEKCEINTTENVQSSDDRRTLDGSVRAGADKPATFKSTIGGTAIQDLSAGGFVAYTMTNKGVETPFVFTPNTIAARKVTGVCYPIPLRIGGDAGEVGPSSDFTWRCKGDPVLS